MKNLRSLCLSAMTLVAIGNAYAQDSYNRFQINFAPRTLEIKDIKWEDSDIDDGWEDAKLKTPGFGIGFIHGIKLTQSMPIYLETGANATFDIKSVSDSKSESMFGYTVSQEEKHNYLFLDLSIPVVALYRVQLNDKMSIDPHFGLNLKFNLLGMDKWEENQTSNTEYIKSYSEEGKARFFGDSEFDGEEASDAHYFGEGDDYKAKRFQFGLNLGVAFNFGDFRLGYTFQPDLTKYAVYGADKDYDVKTRCQVISLGITF